MEFFVANFDTLLISCSITVVGYHGMDCSPYFVLVAHLPIESSFRFLPFLGLLCHGHFIFFACNQGLHLDALCFAAILNFDIDRSIIRETTCLRDVRPYAPSLAFV